MLIRSTGLLWLPSIVLIQSIVEGKGETFTILLIVGRGLRHRALKVEVRDIISDYSGRS